MKPPHPQQLAADLTQGNLAAYHNALVEAANTAAANGKFQRNDTPDGISNSSFSSFNVPTCFSTR